MRPGDYHCLKGDRDSALRRLVHPALGKGALICKTFKKQPESLVAISMEIFLSSEALFLS